MPQDTTGSREKVTTAICKHTISGQTCQDRHYSVLCSDRASVRSTFVLAPMLPYCGEYYAWITVLCNVDGERERERKVHFATTSPFLGYPYYHLPFSYTRNSCQQTLI